MPDYGKFSALSNSMQSKPFASFRNGFGKWFSNESHIKSGLSPPSLPPKPATHQSLAHAGDFAQFPIR